MLESEEPEEGEPRDIEAFSVDPEDRAFFSYVLHAGKERLYHKKEQAHAVALTACALVWHLSAHEEPALTFFRHTPLPWSNGVYRVRQAAYNANV